MYPFLFRTVLSRLDPEFAHHAGMAVIRVLGVWPLAPITRALAKPDPSLATRALGLTFDSPFGVAAGFDKNVVGVRGLGALGFGHVEVGTVTAIAQEGNPRPRLFRLVPDRAVVNRMGFNNRGAEAAEPRLRSLRRRRPRTIVGVNIGKSRVVDVADATVRLRPERHAPGAARGLPGRQRVIAEHARACAACRPSRRWRRCSRRCGMPRAPRRCS